MRPLTSIVVVTLLSLGTFALNGCESANPSSAIHDDRSGFAGGNGEFGESPAQAGAYDSSSAGAHSTAPTAVPNSGNPAR